MPINHDALFKLLLSEFLVQLNRMRWRDFLRHPNPLAAALMTRMQVARRERVTLKLAILEQLQGLPLSAKRLRTLNRFIGIYLPLRPELEATVAAELAIRFPQQREVDMSETLTGWEINGQRKVLLRQITKRFGALTEAEMVHMTNYGAEDLALLADAIFDFRSLADVSAWIAAHPRPEWIDPLGEEDDIDDEEIDGGEAL